MVEWNPQRIADRFHEAAVTAHRLPAARVQSFVSVWPDFSRQLWEGYRDERLVLRLPATPEAVDRLIEATRWLRWLDIGQRKLIWARARYVPWRAIGMEVGCDRRTARSRWEHALAIIVAHLNDSLPKIVASEPKEVQKIA